jgi:hypothetical protein
MPTQVNPLYTEYPHPNIYDVRTLLEPFDEGPLIHTFLRDTFFQDRRFPPTALVEFDFRRGRRQMAPFVAPLIGGKAMERKGWETRFYQAPRVAPVRNLRAIEAEMRMMGESIYSGRTAADRAAELMAEDAVFCDEAISRREEWMCREVMINGAIIVTADDGYRMVINYMESAAGPVTNRETPAIQWNQPNSDPMLDIETARLNMVRLSGVNPNVALFGTEAANVFTRNQKVYDLLNNRRFEMGTLIPQIVDPAVTIFGQLPGLQLYTYAEWFEDDVGNLFPMLPANLVLLASTTIQNRIIYGAYTQLEDERTGRFVTYTQARVPFVYGDEEHNHMFYRLTSLPLPMPFDVLGFRIIEPLGPVDTTNQVPVFTPPPPDGNVIRRTEYPYNAPSTEQQTYKEFQEDIVRSDKPADTGGQKAAVPQAGGGGGTEHHRSRRHEQPPPSA